jgi:hypothetical protein
MANSAIRIPIPGSIINAPSAEAGDMLRFDPLLGQGGTFVNFKPLIGDMYPFTKNAVLDFYVSVKDQTETSVWSDAVAKGMTLAASLNLNGVPQVNDIRLGINLPSGRPNYTLEVVGNMMVWGNGVEAGNIKGRIQYYQGGVGTDTTSEYLIFKTPIKSHTDAELDAVQNSLKTGRLLTKHPTTKETYFARVEDIMVAGDGISIQGNTVSVNVGASFTEGGGLNEISSPAGLTIRLDSNRTGGENEAFKVVESVSLPNGQAVDFSLLKVVRQHQAVVDWNGTEFVIGEDTSQTWPAVKMAVGAGTRLLPSGFLIEDGAPVTADANTEEILDQEGYPSTASGGSTYARLFGAVAANPADIILTGAAGDPATAVYYDKQQQVLVSTSQSTGRFGFLPGFGSMFYDNGYANPGSFVAGFLNKHPDGGGIKVKSGDNNNDEFSLFLENGDVSYDTSVTTGSRSDLTARQFTIAPNPTDAVTNGEYRNIVASNAPVFTVRATTGDTFVRGFLVMPFLPGINSTVNGVDNNPTGSKGSGSADGELLYSTHTDATGRVSIRRYTWNAASSRWIGPNATFTLPKGTVYAKADGTLAITKVGDHIPNHGLNGVSNWLLSD